MKSRNIAASARDRLLRVARETGREFNLILTRYALERLLYRISISEHADSFLLKGALLFDLWFDVPHRPTRDADLLGLGTSEIHAVTSLFQAFCRVEGDDGMRFDPDTVRVSEIRKDAAYAGLRVTLLGWLDTARCSVQVDIGYGDTVTPGPEAVEYPVLLSDMRAPLLRTYPRYTVVSEKLQALVQLGMVNSRMKDYFDLWILARFAEFEGAILSDAIRATFLRRQTPMPENLPTGLADEFSSNPGKQTQWQAFLRKNSLQPVALEEIVQSLRTFLLPPLRAAAGDNSFSANWPAGGPWQ